ncbi:hypothetical protein SNOG_13862 [Parastagonospora nodorum SN15]|uniref:Uncharacterized protein n=1 Tax=Phaeosphaeria nodorum (strain SN15 / ATCC MYA-4574 / FGSC 10173) TaxID=321614 RepID=Q0U302_PHANO|nr:hypothetical protein SNOG_13862 [Parastagonospora nodorum SN15]EAT78886.1 hypothetical protein SNOG_13862 [Parastagonospora nodorum SN15]
MALSHGMQWAESWSWSPQERAATPSATGPCLARLRGLAWQWGMEAGSHAYFDANSPYYPQYGLSTASAPSIASPAAQSVLWRPLRSALYARTNGLM